MSDKIYYVKLLYRSKIAPPLEIFANNSNVISKVNSEGF